MFAQIATFLIDTVVSFLVFLLLARFHFQWLRVPFRNPMGEFLLATTNWVVIPARRGILELHVQPGAARSEFAGEHGGRLKVRLAAPPVEGKANAALVEFLARYFGVPKRNVRIAAGFKSRRKRVVIEGAQWTRSPTTKSKD